MNVNLEHLRSRRDINRSLRCLASYFIDVHAGSDGLHDTPELGRFERLSPSEYLLGEGGSQPFLGVWGQFLAVRHREAEVYKSNTDRTGNKCQPKSLHAHF